jgi:hypothetical protein
MLPFISEKFQTFLVDTTNVWIALQLAGELVTIDITRNDSIRINDQWRICFEWPKGSTGPVNVEIVDYH